MKTSRIFSYAMAMCLCGTALAAAADDPVRENSLAGLYSEAEFDCSTEGSKGVNDKICIQTTKITGIDPKTCILTSQVTAAECKPRKGSNCDSTSCAATVGTEVKSIDWPCLIGG